ncbi:uncharacterized protein LAESUDRAFT_717186 [Laetiporus sulphureus 93-53]|uniref:Uncharacterized protein n=1 Tax=Laetiporus sulphureus 93-53 TaxID=1314785 RepID=A0A165C160_9APHY|nr:uncharacterized protein LAESUDRAFT_717186 [Laetiporus sulphureus 93-53]KZT02014.1 hypothetical protein LAESUDRAFT_717186 [Laetiporus sulphureus 93-53]
MISTLRWECAELAIEWDWSERDAIRTELLRCAPIIFKECAIGVDSAIRQHSMTYTTHVITHPQSWFVMQIFTVHHSYEQQIAISAFGLYSLFHIVNKRNFAWLAANGPEWQGHVSEKETGGVTVSGVLDVLAAVSRDVPNGIFSFSSSNALGHRQHNLADLPCQLKAIVITIGHRNAMRGDGFS